MVSPGSGEVEEDVEIALGVDAPCIGTRPAKLEHPFCGFLGAGLGFFDSYEAAMENSKLPETNELAQKMVALGDGPPTFHDLDVIADRS